jgi:hypothetical protein
VITHIDGVVNAMCERCWNRWPLGDFEGNLLAEHHICDECIRQGHTAPPTTLQAGWCGTPRLMTGLSRWGRIKAHFSGDT